MKVALITNFCSHYRIGLFEEIARHFDTDFIFFSDGGERYWERKNQIWTGKFNGYQLWGFSIPPRIRITPSLVTRILTGNYDVIIKCINGKFALPVTFMLAKAMRKPFVLWTGIWMHPNSFLHRLTFPITKFIYRHSDAIVVYGEHVKRYLVGLGVPDEKIFLGWNSIDNNLFSKEVSSPDKVRLRKQLQIGGAKVVLYVGRLEKEKGLEYLLEAFERVEKESDTFLLLVGTGSHGDSIKSHAEKRGIHRIMFVDYVENSSLHKYYSIADVFVLPSVTTPYFKEPWGLVINEAMNQGCPLVATSAVGAAVGGLVENGKTGYVVNERDSAALSSAILRILSDPALASEMGRESRRKIAGWSYQKQADGFFRAIESVRVG